VIKGYKGSGTEHDPILIETIQDLAGLQNQKSDSKATISYKRLILMVLL
jgi:hypothetical protein